MKVTPMAVRPVFLSDPEGEGGALYREINVEFVWHPGLSPAQRQRSVESLHGAVAGDHRLLEVSTKSQLSLGRALSAFNLGGMLEDGRRAPVEVQFQASKVFIGGGPYLDLMEASPRDARSDVRLKESGSLVGFEYAGERWPLLPPSLFYDWLYITAVSLDDALCGGLQSYDAFTDIEFNPKRSINCQARSCAICAALLKRGELWTAIASGAAYRAQAAVIYGVKGAAESQQQLDL